MKTALFGFSSIMAKEWLHIARDRTTLIIALLVPMIQLTLFGFALDYDVRHVRTVVLDFDKSDRSRDYVRSLHNTEYLDVVGYLTSPAQIADELKCNGASVGIIIPADFSRRYGTSRPPTVRVLIDGSDGQVANPARNAFARPPDASRPNAVDVRFNILFNPDIRTQIYTIPALAAVLLQLITVSLTSFSLVREREQGTLEQLMVTPVGRLGLVLGKVVPYSVIGLIELTSVLFMGSLVFNVQSVGSLLLLYLLAVPFILASLSLGLLISTVARNQAQAMQLSMLITMPSILLSGYIAPRETLPLPLLWLSYLFPVTHFVRIARGIEVRGAGFVDLLPSVLWLLALVIALMALATLRFKKSVS